MKLIKRFRNIASPVWWICIVSIVGLTGLIVYGAAWESMNPCLEKEKTGETTCTSICAAYSGNVCIVHTTSCKEVEVCTVRQMSDGTIQTKEPV